jgi:hypothetical protein
MRGEAIRLSGMRALLRDIFRACADVPTITVQRTMSITRLFEARDACLQRPPWSALFVKGYGLVAQEMDELRRAYVKLPWPRIYQYDHSVANIAVERSHAGANTVFNLLIGHPAELAIVHIAARIRHAQSVAVGDVPEFRRSLALARVPWPLRRLIIWAGLNLGRRRSRFLGTFGLSTVGALGGDLVTVIWPVATVMTYGPISPDGSIVARIVFDHRVTDAAPIARALARLEEVLNGAVADELLATGGGVAGAAPA